MSLSIAVDHQIRIRRTRVVFEPYSLKRVINLEVNWPDTDDKLVEQLETQTNFRL